MGNLSKNFSDVEFECQCGCGTGRVTEDLVRVLQEVRNHFGKSVTITSGIRCVSHNKNVGGASKSKHIKGIAADFKIKGIKPQVVYEWICDKYPESFGIGLYSRWVHLDVRKVKARWGST